MEPIHIRRGVVADAPVLAEFAARTFADAFGADNRHEDLQAHLASTYGVIRQARELGDPALVTLLAYRGEVLVAYAQVGYRSPPPCVTSERPIEVRRFYVDRPAHGSGVAQRLMAAARAVAGADGGLHLWLGVWERNSRALAFYRRAGFVDVGSTDFYVGSDRQTDRVLVAEVLPAVRQDSCRSHCAQA